MVLLNKFEFSLPDISQSVDAVAQRLGQWKLFSLQRRPKSTHLHIFQPPRGKPLACLTRRQDSTLHYTQLGEPSNQSPVLNYHFDLINHLTIKLSKMLLDQAISDLGRDQVLPHLIVPIRHLFHNEARHLIDRIANLADFPSGTKATSGKQVHQYTNRLIRTYFLNRETTNILDRIMPTNRDAPTIEQYNQTLLNQNLFTNLLLEAPHLLRHYHITMPCTNGSQGGLTRDAIEAQLADALGLQPAELTGLAHTSANFRHPISLRAATCRAFASINPPPSYTAVQAIDGSSSFHEKFQQLGDAAWQHWVHILNLLAGSTPDRHITFTLASIASYIHDQETNRPGQPFLPSLDDYIKATKNRLEES